MRHLHALEDNARRLGVATVSHEQATEANIDPGLIEAVIAGLPVEGEQPPGRAGQTSGSGAIQALLSLSGRPGEEDGSEAVTGAEGQTGADGDAGFEEWWDKVLNGTLAGSGYTGDEQPQ